MNAKILSVYCFTIFIASIIPGPSSLLALTQGARYGLSAGALSGIGNVIASVLQGVLALLIISQVGKISTSALEFIKYLGAAYIIYLGVTLLKVESFGPSPESKAAAISVKGYKHLWDGFAFAIFNPKALTFFAALFPQFIGGGAVSIELIAMIFLPIAIIAFACFIFYVVAGSLLIGVMSRTRHIGKIFGGMIIAAGGFLLLS